MRILISGFYPNSWRVERLWIIDNRPLTDADALHEYDLIVLKPTMFEGIFPNFQDAPKHGACVNWQQGERFAETIRQRKLELWLASRRGRVVLFPSTETTFHYRIPKPLPPTIRNLNEVIGRDFDNYEEKTVSNLDLLSLWQIRFRPGAGKSVKIVCPGHPMNDYFQLAKLRWDTAFTIEKNYMLLATDRDGFWIIGAEVEVSGCRVLLLPECHDRDALITLVRGVEQVREWYDRTKVRSKVERKLIGELEELRSQMSMLMNVATVKAQKLYDAEALFDHTLSKDPVLEAAYSDYRQACLERNITLLYRAYERLKKSKGGERPLQSYLKWDRNDLDEWGRLRNSITRVANRSERHPNREDPAASPNVTDQEFDDAVQAMKTFLEKYVDVLLEENS